MRKNITIVENSLRSHYLGAGSIAERMHEVAKGELAGKINDPSVLTFDEIEIDATLAYRQAYKVSLFLNTNTDPARRIEKFSLAFLIVNNSPLQILDKTLVTETARPYNLNPDEALFFAGLGFRALSALNSGSAIHRS